MDQLTPEEFQEKLNTKLKELAELCAEHWGDAPELETHVAPAMRVGCDFDLGDFPHQGRTFIIHEGNARRRTPERVALEIMREVASHRNECNRCGLGIPAIFRRVHAAEYALKQQMGDARQAIYLEREPNHFTPADIPERHLFPALAKRLDRALEGLGQPA